MNGPVQLLHVQLFDLGYCTFWNPNLQFR